MNQKIETIQKYANEKMALVIAARKERAERKAAELETKREKARPPVQTAPPVLQPEKSRPAEHHGSKIFQKKKGR